MGISFFSSILTARVLGPEGRGIVAAVQLAATLSSEISQLGLSAAFIYRVRTTTETHPLTTLGSCAALVALTSALTSATIAHQSGGIIASHAGLTLCLSLGLAVYTFFQNSLQVEPSLNYYNAYRILNGVGCLFLFLGLWQFYSLTPVAALAAQTATTYIVLAFSTTSLVTLLIKDRQRLEGNARTQPNIGRTLIWGFKYHATSLTGLAINNIDKLVIYFRASLGDLGAYAAAYAVSRTITVFQQSISTTLFSRYAGESEELLDSATAFCFRMTFLPLLALSIALGLASNWLLYFLFGSQYVSIAPAFAVLLIDSVFAGSSWVLAQRFNASGRPAVVFARQVPSLLFVAATIPFLPDSNLPLWIALSVLSGSVIRLWLSMAMYRWVLNRPAPNVMPRKQEVLQAIKLLSGWSRTRG